MKEQSLPRVSIVTPVHNGADHLVECIESVLAQTHTNWEYTIVDNCSTDGTLTIAQQYAAKDSRIRVYVNHQFLEAIPNHNVAMRQLSRSSKYCKVVFADDWLFPGCLEEMVAVAEEHPGVGIVGALGLMGNNVMWAGLPVSMPKHLRPGHLPLVASGTPLRVRFGALAFVPRRPSPKP